MASGHRGLTAPARVVWDESDRVVGRGRGCAAAVPGARPVVASYEPRSWPRVLSWSNVVYRPTNRLWLISMSEALPSVLPWST